MVYALAADISIIKLLISCSKYGLYLCIEREGRPRGNWIWLHVQGRYIVFNSLLLKCEHLCVSRQSLTDTELFQFEWVPDQSKSEYDHPWCCDDAASIAFSHAEYTEKMKSWSRENNFRYVEITRKLLRRELRKRFAMVSGMNDMFPGNGVWRGLRDVFSSAETCI